MPIVSTEEFLHALQHARTPIDRAVQGILDTATAEQAFLSGLSVVLRRLGIPAIELTADDMAVLTECRVEVTSSTPDSAVFEIVSTV